MRGRARAWALPALLVLFGVAIVGRRWVDVVVVEGRSMAPALAPGDRLLVARAAPRVGDVVLAADPRDARRELIKRVASVDALGVTLRGDNPAASTDARTFGALRAESVRWRAVLRYWPISRAGHVPRAPLSVEVGGEDACAFPQALIVGD